MSHLISIIIPTYDRFDLLLKSINSVKNQTYKDVEIIVVNDCSTDKRYYNHDWNGINVIHKDKSSKEEFGFSCVGNVRNIGVKQSSGDYIAFLDDDDEWLPNKLETQLSKMLEKNFKFSCTEAYINSTKTKQLSQHFFNEIRNHHKSKGSNMLDNGYPEVFTKELINIHNSCITSSVLLCKSFFKSVGYFKHVPMGTHMPEDYDYWLRLLEVTDCLFLSEPMLKYNTSSHKKYQF